MGSSESLTIGVDASRSKSGGAKAHLRGLLCGFDPGVLGVSRVHVWAPTDLLEQVPDFGWLEKHSPQALKGSISRQLWWQYRTLPQEARSVGCDVLFNTDAGSVCPFLPSVTLSQDMLSFEPGEMLRFGVSKAFARLLVLRFVQVHALKNAEGAIFLTRYAAAGIQRFTGALPNYRVIPHGVGQEFNVVPDPPRKVDGWRREVEVLYVSDADMYKHQWHVVEAMRLLRTRGYQVRLRLVGGGHGRAQRRLEAAMHRHDPLRSFVTQELFIKHQEIPSYLRSADLFVFASSCENMPITLLEAMKAGLPIACSNRGPMPEVLEDGGAYCDPEDATSIASAVARILDDPEYAAAIAQRARSLASQYSWERCSRETWAYLSDVARGVPRSQRAVAGNRSAEVG